ncbi:MAG: GTP cyclohydrolase I FolE [Deltaproteobacteria bacterium]|nr:GTP cyclohydrolase I FolE [Deltaproteobacteria bacterium]
MAEDQLEKYFRGVLSEIGEDPARPGLSSTPERAARAFKFMTSGYKQNLDEIVNNAVFPTNNTEMIVVKDIELYSLCEHHLLPFFGRCHVGYLPDKKIIGLSKIARIVDAFARRLQVQENLTQQIAEAIIHYTGGLGAGVVIEARHLCMMMRGVEKQRSSMKTSCMLGHFRSDPKTRSEFLALVADKEAVI